MQRQFFAIIQHFCTQFLPLSHSELLIFFPCRKNKIFDPDRVSFASDLTYTCMLDEIERSEMQFIDLVQNYGKCNLLDIEANKCVKIS